MSIYLNACGIVCALGDTPAGLRDALLSPTPSTGVAQHEPFGWVGAVTAPMPSLCDVPIAQRSRNNALLRLALSQLATALQKSESTCAKERMGVVIGTSTSGVLQAEMAHGVKAARGTFPPDYHYGQQELCAPAEFVAQQVGALGPAYSVSTACSSSAKALIAAARLLRAGMVDVVVAGGADALCQLTVRGFGALGQVASKRCNPMSKNRQGINIGEGAALFVVSRAPGPVMLLGCGESSDAHHISAPDPTGSGAQLAVQTALQRAGMQPKDIDYVNLHGTGTVHNDAMESLVMSQMFGQGPLMSSTKPLTGHALGAAGAIEAALMWLLLQHNPQGQVPPHLWDAQADPALPRLRLAPPHAALGRPLRTVLSPSFAFGGSNAVLVLGRAA